MMTGNPETFAIESHITRAYEELGLRALGFFTVMIKGRRFGVHEEDATMMANSYDEVCRRIANRGQHTAPFGADGCSRDIAFSVMSALYSDPPEKMSALGISYDALDKLVHGNRLEWAPDGDAAFDDGSHVLQFDVGDHVRLIGFKRSDEGLFDPCSLVDQRLPADEFYSILEEWRDAFVSEWERYPKERLSE
ncbi:MAG: Imm42 family immunity protein [Acidobacteriota bacterium]|jgi:hypothetical protein